MGDCGNVCCVAAVVKNSVFFSLGVLKYVVCLCRGCDGCCVFYLYCEAWSCRCSCMGSVSVSSCRCCMFVSCVHPVAVLNAAFCMTCSLLMLVEDAIGDHTEHINNKALPMATHPKVLGLTLDPKLTYSTHIHNISVQAHKPLQIIKALTVTGWGKQKETLMATYKAVMRPALCVSMI